MRIRPPKFLFRLFLFSMLLGTLPVLVLGVLSYQKSSEIIQDKVAKGNMLNLEQTQQRVEQILKTADKSAVQFISASLVSSAMNMQLTPDQFETVNGLLQGLHQLQSFDLGIYDVLLVSLNQGWAINNSTEVFRLDSFAQAEMVRNYAKYGKTSFWTIAEAEGQVHMVKKLPLHSLVPSGLMIMKFQSKELNKLLANNSDLGEVMILNEEGVVLAHSNPAYIGKDFSHAAELQSLLQGTDAIGTYHTSVSGDVGVTFRKSPYNGWTYVSISSVDLITKDSKVIEWYTYTACLLILAVTMLLSWLGSRRMYGPISRLYRSLQAEPEQAAYHNRDELQYIGSQVHEMLHTKHRLTGIIEGQQRQVEELFMIKLYQGEVRAKEIKERLGVFTDKEAWKQVCVMAVQIDTLEDTRYAEMDKDLLLFAINNMVGEIVPSSARLKPTVIHHTQVTLIGRTGLSEDSYKKQINDWAAEIRQKVEQFLELGVSVGISRFYPTVESAQMAYQDATEALKYTIRTGPGSVIHIVDVEPEGTILSRFPHRIEQELLDAVKLADFAQADLLLDDYLQEVFQEKVGHREYFVPLTAFLMDLIRMAQHLGEPIESLYDGEKSLIDQLYRLKTIMEIGQWFRLTLIYPMMELLEKKRKHQYAKISDQMLAMIHQEAETDLSLDLCASRLGYHPDYIRGVFRKEVGVNFSDYVSSFRLQLAKTMLVDTELKIAEIAERLHYNNSQNFIRYFRKQEGITPGQYREKYLSRE
ncbi:AraC family transcriptional regulator [Paenibacillus sp. HWE-109]|uniref:AraC family transcriptional regulator n=1 Tax=Paenibacillus sp. HWE-109 TaxID=1306526 RepID=UPI001EDCDD44|nr:helix-turn-helix domain-containing protein [Paenibacillus sp. HWE-109]UKS29997.1 AraC family transcriptional regulator [Paenibacillus sp. HWE-109]